VALQEIFAKSYVEVQIKGGFQKRWARRHGWKEGGVKTATISLPTKKRGRIQPDSSSFSRRLVVIESKGARGWGETTLWIE